MVRTFYKTAIRLEISYVVEWWETKKQHIHRMGVSEVRMLRWMSSKTGKDGITMNAFRDPGVAPIFHKMRDVD